MTPAQIRQIAREEARRALASTGGGGLPTVWTNEVQIYNASLAEQGVRTLRGLAQVVSDLQTSSVEGDEGAAAIPRGPERAFEFEDGRVVLVRHGENLGAEDAVIVRWTGVRYDDEGRLESVLDAWTHEGRAWGRTFAVSYDAAGRVALAVRSPAGPLGPFLLEVE